MKRACTFVLLAGLAVAPAYGQAPAETPPNSASTAADDPTEAERNELAAELREAQTSPLDMIHALEAHLRKYPNSPVRPEIMPLLAKEAVEAGDTQRIALYGVPALEAAPNDVLLLDRVSSALLNLGGRENAEKALEYGKRFEGYVANLPVVDGSDPARNQEDHDRALERALLYQSRAFTLLEAAGDARIKAELAFMAFPEANSAWHSAAGVIDVAQSRHAY